MVSRSPALNAIRALLTILVILGACVDAPTSVDPRHTAKATFGSAVNIEELPEVDSLARGIAMALGHDELRGQLHMDLRNSPFRHHAIHLTSYLRGARGGALLASVAAQLGISNNTLLGNLERLPDLELVIERGIDRMRWEGGRDIVVYGSTVPSRLRARSDAVQKGFNAQGEVVDIPMWSVAPFPYLAVRPTVAEFGADPEAARQAAPQRSGRTVSTRGDELLALSQVSCDESVDPYCCPPNVDECEGEPGSGTPPGGVTLPSPYTLYYCIGVESGPLNSTNDADNDGLRDDCERELAHAFRPVLAMSSADEAPENEPYWAVARAESPVGTPVVAKILYALSYYRDPGSVGGLYAHDGDTEWIMIEVDHTTGSTWRLQFATLSAHWGVGSGADQTARYQGDDLEYPYESRGRPRVWVARNKHANYRSASVCNNAWNDDCNTFSGTTYRDLWFEPGANLGNYFHQVSPNVATRLVDCVYSRYQGTNGFPGQECYWTNMNYFAGWQGNHGQVVSTTAYRDVLNFFGF